MYIYYLDQIKCVKCCFCESIEDPNVFITLLWLYPEGELLYEAFLREQLNTGGIFQSAMEDEVIKSSIFDFQVLTNRLDWKKHILLNDVFYSMQYECEDLTGKYIYQYNYNRIMDFNLIYFLMTIHHYFWYLHTHKFIYL
jgi:hypothetical protein